MPKLPDCKYSEQGKTGEVVAFTSGVLVDPDGVFSMTIPESLTDTAESLSIPYEYSRTKWRVHSQSLSECKRMIRDIIREFLLCTTETSIVLLYDFVSTCHFVKNSSGKIFPNGNFCPNDFKWTENKTTEHNDDYILGFRAKIFRKLHHKRPASERIDYEPVHINGNIDCELGEWGEFLNSFVNIGISDEAHELPYTEDTAKLFYEAMMGLCALSDKLSQALSNPKKLLSMPQVLMLQADN